MKKVLSLALFALSVTLFACGSDGGGGSAQNPNSAASQFSKPTGTLTDANANNVGQSAVSGSGSAGFASPSPTTLATAYTSRSSKSQISSKYAVTDPTTCVVAHDDGSSEIDWKCVYDVDTTDTCTGSGTTTIGASTSDDFFTITYNGYTVNCGSDDKFSCNGTVNVSTTTPGLSCSKLACTIDDDAENFNGCVNASGDVLLTVDDKTFVSTSVETDGTCTKVIISITDSIGPKTLSCTVTSADTGCTTLDGVHTVGSCVIQ